MKTNQNTKKKIAYQKPVLRVIELSADEVMAVGCKMQSSSTGPIGPPNCTSVQCFAEGS